MSKKDFYTKLVGVTKENDCGDDIQDILERISDTGSEGMLLELEHEPDNLHDENAIKAFFNDEHIGYINRALAAELVEYVDNDQVEAKLAEITGGDEKSYGCNIHIKIYDKDEVQVPLFLDEKTIRSLNAIAFNAYAKEFFRRTDKYIGSGISNDEADRVSAQLELINNEVTRRYAKYKAQASEPQKPFTITSRDMIVSKNMVEYCKYFGFNGGISDRTCGNLFREAEDSISPDTEVVMAFIALKDFVSVMENGGTCAFVFSATKVIIETMSEDWTIPVAEITGFSLEEGHPISKLVLEGNGERAIFGIENRSAKNILNCCQRSLSACKAEIEEKRRKEAGTRSALKG